MTREEQEKLFKENVNLIHYALNKLNITLKSPDYYDHYQLGSIGLWKACQTFDKDRNAFSTYAMKCINNEILGELRKEKRRVKYVSLDAIILKNDNNNDVALIEMMEEDNSYLLSNDVSEFYKMLKEIDLPNKDILLEYLSGTPQRKLGIKHNVSQSQISRILKKQFTELRKILAKKFDYRK